MNQLLYEVQVALTFIPADDRELWIRIGMAIKSEFGDAGFSIFDYWSSTSDNYNEKSTRDVWRSFKDGAVKINTVFYIARKNGYSSGKIADLKLIPIKKAPAPQKNSTTDYALAMWSRVDREDQAVATHPYAIKKSIESAGGAGRATVSGSVIGQQADCIVIPVHDINTQKLTAIQCVNSAGDKQTFGTISGNALLLGNTLDKKTNWFICEGWASAYSTVFHHFNGNACAAISFGKTNLDKISEKIAEVYNPTELRILRELDA